MLSNFASVQALPRVRPIRLISVGGDDAAAIAEQSRSLLPLEDDDAILSVGLPPVDKCLKQSLCDTTSSANCRKWMTLVGQDEDEDAFC